VDMSEVGGFELPLDAGGYGGGEQESEVESRVQREDVECEVQDGSDVAPGEGRRSARREVALMRRLSERRLGPLLTTLRAGSRRSGLAW
jgi:hypothetical protein